MYISINFFLIKEKKSIF